jgi:hypothetical protein
MHVGLSIRLQTSVKVRTTAPPRPHILEVRRDRDARDWASGGPLGFELGSRAMPSDDEIRQILSGPGTSHWLKSALIAALDRAPVDAVNVAELMAIVLGRWVDQITATARAALGTR